MPTASNLSETVKSKFLQLNGGTVTGAIAINRADGHIYKKDASGRMMLRGGTSTATDGASIYLTGKDYSSGASTFQVRCHDGTNDKSLIAKPDGTLTWDGKPVVCVTKWISGASYYRVYSDGFIEQGGQTASWSNNPDTTITLHKAFTNTNYTVSCINIGSTKDGYTGDVCLKSKATSSFVINCHTNNRGGLNWYACGY